MARPTPVSRTRSCIHLVTKAKSTQWPGATRFLALYHLGAALLVAIAQFGVDVALAARLMRTGDAVRCGVEGSGEVRNLPVTFATASAPGEGEGGGGIQFLSWGEGGEKGHIIANLIFSPFFLALFLAFQISLHFSPAGISNRTAMFTAVLYACFFAVAALVTPWFDLTSKEQYGGREGGEGWCLVSNETMRGLKEEGFRRWGLVVGSEILGWCGGLCMAGYFCFAVLAAYRNREAAAPRRWDQHRLEHLRRNNRPINSGSFHTAVGALPQAHLDASEAATSNSQAVGFDTTFPEAVAQPDGIQHESKRVASVEDEDVDVEAEAMTTEGHGLGYGEDIFRNPFADPDNPFADPRNPVQ